LTDDAYRPGPFAVKSIDTLLAEAGEEGHSLKRAVGAISLTAIGLGAIIGTGIFIVIGAGAAEAGGAAVIVSFAIAAFACAFSAMAYAELASSIPVAGSTFTYTYATMGEIIAWLIGWNLILEFGVASAAVAVGWGANLNSFLDTTFNTTISAEITTSPEKGGTFNLPAVLIVAAIMVLLLKGIRETTRLNNIMVTVKITTLIFFISPA
jgi:APA family basic amino acid/polyamine antiporter